MPTTADFGPEVPRPDYDQALKRMLTRAHDPFLSLIAPDLTWRGEHSPELPAVARRADLVWEVVTRTGETALLHVELQTDVAPNLGERLAEYAIRLWRRDHVPVRSLVVFLREAPTIPVSPFIISVANQETLRFSFHIVQLWQIPYQQVLVSDSYGLWPLVSLMRGATVETTLEVAHRIATAPLPQDIRAELTGLLGILAGVRLPLRAVLAELRRNPMISDLIQETGWAQAWKEIWNEEGREQGRNEGKLEGERRMTRLALEGRFGHLDENILAALNTADETVLQTVVLNCTTDTVEQVRIRLGLV